MVAHACNPWEMKAGGSGAQRHPYAFKVSLGYIRCYLKRKKRKNLKADRTSAINKCEILPTTQEIKAVTECQIK